MFLEQEPLVAIFVVLGIEYLELFLGPEFLVYGRIQMVDESNSKKGYLSLHSTSVLSNPCFLSSSEAFFHFLLFMLWLTRIKISSSYIGHKGTSGAQIFSFPIVKKLML
jgi:hypothetical protein